MRVPPQISLVEEWIKAIHGFEFIIASAPPIILKLGSDSLLGTPYLGHKRSTGVAGAGVLFVVTSANLVLGDCHSKVFTAVTCIIPRKYCGLKYSGILMLRSFTPSESLIFIDIGHTCRIKHQANGLNMNWGIKKFYISA